MQGATLEGVGLSRRHFMTMAGAVTAAGALAMGTTSIASADAGAATGTFSGSISPDSGGNHARYTIAKPTGSKVTITLVYSPYVAGDAHRVGFSIWQKGTKIYHGNGQATGLKDHVNSNTVTTTVTPAAGELLLIKVFNYSPETVSYTLTISGDTAAPHTHKRLVEPAPVELHGTATGTLEGVGGLTTAGYSVSAPTGKQVTVTLAYGPYDAGEAPRVGFSVWQNGKRILRKNGLATGFKDNVDSSQPCLLYTSDAADE